MRIGLLESSIDFFDDTALLCECRGWYQGPSYICALDTRNNPLCRFFYFIYIKE